MSTVQEIDAMGVDAGTVVAPEGAVKARGYWEQVWRRLRRDRFALAGGAFIVLMFFVAFVGAPIAAKRSTKPVVSGSPVVHATTASSM